VPTISSRGLGIINLDERRALKQLQRIGVFMIGQTADICPADKKLYALATLREPCLRNRSLSRAS
jgi:hypothetical protein